MKYIFHSNFFKKCRNISITFAITTEKINMLWKYFSLNCNVCTFLNASLDVRDEKLLPKDFYEITSANEFF